MHSHLFSFRRRLKRQARNAQNAALGYQQFEPRRLLATLAGAGISQSATDLINNVGGTFEGDVGNNNNGVTDIVYTNLFLNNPTVQNTLEAIEGSQTIPAGATMITNVAGLSAITAGTDASPNVYGLVGNFTITSDIDVPSNVHIYLDGSITYVGTYTTPDIFNNGNGESENREEAIFRLQSSRNVKLIGVDNAQLIGNPNLASSSPHVNGVLIQGSGSTNGLVEGFEMRALWQGVTADFGTSDITVQNNYILDSVKRAIWFLGTTNSVVTHNFLENSGADGIDFDAYVADSVAYENVMLGNGRFAFFVEEGANNNFSARQVSVLHRMGNPNQTRADGALRFMLGNASNGTGNSFVANNPGIVTRDNFFLDNTTFQPSSQRTNQGGGFIATGDNLQVGNSYFYGNQGFGVADITSEAAPFRDVTVKAIYDSRLPSGEITVSSDSRTSFNSYNLTNLLNQWDATYSGGNRPIRSDIAALPAPLQIFQETGGRVVIEAENFTNRVAGVGAASGKTFNLLHDDSVGGSQPDTETASGDLGLIAEFNGSNLVPDNSSNVGNSLVGPRVDYEINFDTPGIYRVFLRLRAPIANDNSIHVGFDGSAVTLGGFGVGVSGTDWAWVDDVVSGPQNFTVNVPAAGLHTLNLWMREDGVQVDKIVLDQAGVTPTGFGPVESALVTVTPPTVVTVGRGAGGALDGSGLARPDLAGAVSFTFSEDVVVNSGGLTASNLSVPGVSVDLTGLSFNYDPITFTATWDFSTLTIPLAPAFYDLELASGSVESVDSGAFLDGDANGIGGGPFSDTLYVAIPGDANLDGWVTFNGPNGSDYTTVGLNLGNNNPTWATGDFDGNGEVNVTDHNIFTGVNSGDLAVTLANLHIDLRPPAQPPAQLPVMASSVEPVRVVESVAVLSDASPLEPIETPVAPIELTSDEGLAFAETDESLSANAVAFVEQELVRLFDTTVSAVNEGGLQSFMDRQADNLDRRKLEFSRLFIDADALVASVNDSFTDFEIELPETIEVKAVVDEIATVVDRLFSHEDDLFHFWS